MELYNKELDVCEIQNRWYRQSSEQNCGALITFIGIVREENNIEALSFDIYEPILKKWFDSWQKIATEKNAKVFFAHSIGDVKINKSSYMAGVLSPQRKVALRLIDDFVENFKANAPIWKYDVINSQRFYAKDRSHKIDSAGLLSE